MPQSFLLQDWTHVEGTANQPIVQGEEGWLDLSGYTDVVFYLSVKDRTGSTAFDYETSPSMDDDLFNSVVGAGGVTPGTNSRTVTIIRYSAASEPLSRWIRWTVTNPSSNYAATFRIWVTSVSRG